MIHIFYIYNEEYDLYFWTCEPPSREEVLLEEADITLKELNSVDWIGETPFSETDREFIKYELGDLDD